MFLKQLAAAEEELFANDLDQNSKRDYWTGDVAGLYCLTPLSTPGCDDESIKLIELSLAGADGAPLEDRAAGGEYPSIARFTIQAPVEGYYFRALTTDASVSPPAKYQEVSDAGVDQGAVHNSVRFGFCAYPFSYSDSCRKTFIINEKALVYWKDTGGKPISQWPSDAELKKDWKRMDPVK